MKKFLAACAVGAFLSVSSMQAGILTVTMIPGANAAAKLANAQGVLDAYISGNFGSGFQGKILENFESYRASKMVAYDPLTGTGIGDFKTMPGNQTSLGNAGTTDPGWVVLDKSTTPFSGRYDVSGSLTNVLNNAPALNTHKNWLDSNDNTKVGLDVLPPKSNLFFFLNDPADVQGKLTITSTGGGETVNFTPNLTNGSLYLVTWRASFVGETVSEILFDTGNRRDGWGVDAFGTVVPEPSFYTFAALGLAGVVTAYKRRKKNA